MTARGEILGRIRSRLPAFANKMASARETGLPPMISPPNLPEAFLARAIALYSSTARVGTWAQVPQAVRTYLESEGLGPTHLVAWPALAERCLPWAAAGLAPIFRSALEGDRIGITGCFRAIAETGTLMLLGADGTPASVSLLPETHVALVEAEQVLASLEQAFSQLPLEGKALPPAINLVSGPSRTGDIEQTMVLGAHGPCRVHLILIG